MAGGDYQTGLPPGLDGTHSTGAALGPSTILSSSQRYEFGTGFHSAGPAITAGNWLIVPSHLERIISDRECSPVHEKDTGSVITTCSHWKIRNWSQVAVISATAENDGQADLVQSPTFFNALTDLSSLLAIIQPGISNQPS
jgi:hypothetical protein